MRIKAKVIETREYEFEFEHNPDSNINIYQQAYDAFNKQGGTTNLECKESSDIWISPKYKTK